jgi:hypothetical protein
MELTLLAMAAIGVMISIYGKYAYERARRRSRDHAIDPQSSALPIVGVAPHYVAIDRALSELSPPRSRRCHRPMREND